MAVCKIFAIKWLFRGQKFRILGALRGAAPTRREDLSETCMRFHAKCHDSRLNRRRDICHRHIHRITSNSLSIHTSAWRITASVKCNGLRCRYSQSGRPSWTFVLNPNGRTDLTVRLTLEGGAQFLRLCRCCCCWRCWCGWTLNWCLMHHTHDWSSE